MMAMKNRFRLSTGRFIAFTEYGDSEGFPVLFAHGNLNSRKFLPCWGKTQAETAAAKVRIIAVDRPGYGESDFEKERTYMGWTKDIDELTDHLGLKRFVVAGYSSGGPHALACATGEKKVGTSMFNKVAGVCLISSDGPYALLGEEYIKKVYHIDQPVTMEKAIRRAGDMYHMMKDSYENIPSPEKRDIALNDIENAVKQGLEGAAYDTILETSLWDYTFGEVTKPIHFWHGEEDSDVPPFCAKFIFDKLPTQVQEVSKLHFLPGENHTLLRRHWKSILSSIEESFGSSSQSSL